MADDGGTATGAGGFIAQAWPATWPGGRPAVRLVAGASPGRQAGRRLAQKKPPHRADEPPRIRTHYFRWGAASRRSGSGMRPDQWVSVLFIRQLCRTQQRLVTRPDAPASSVSQGFSSHVYSTPSIEYRGSKTSVNWSRLLRNLPNLVASTNCVRKFFRFAFSPIHRARSAVDGGQARSSAPSLSRAAATTCATCSSTCSLRSVPSLER